MGNLRLESLSGYFSYCDMGGGPGGQGPQLVMSLFNLLNDQSNKRNLLL